MLQVRKKQNRRRQGKEWRKSRRSADIVVIRINKTIKEKKNESRMAQSILKFTHTYKKDTRRSIE